jgi:thiosulfate/3-mercaptopyruvate sulfurtransferase
VFSEACSRLGLSNDDHIVVYTAANCFSAARCWWTFQAFSHSNVRAPSLRCILILCLGIKYV